MKLRLECDEMDPVDITVAEGQDPVEAVLRAIEKEANENNNRYFPDRVHVYVTGDWNALIYVDTTSVYRATASDVYVRRGKK